LARAHSRAPKQIAAKSNRADYLIKCVSFDHSIIGKEYA
jgi:hypothetical protein